MLKRIRAERGAEHNALIDVRVSIALRVVDAGSNKCEPRVMQPLISQTLIRTRM